ncbi:MAG: FIG021292: hypothetical protein, partial [uncultured Solirubrobacteraceae bacterium]
GLQRHLASNARLLRAGDRRRLRRRARRVRRRRAPRPGPRAGGPHRPSPVDAPAPRRDRRHLRRRDRRGPPHRGAAPGDAGARRGRAAPRGDPGAPRRAALVQRRAGRGRQVQGRHPGDHQPAGRRDRSLQAPDRLRLGPDLRARRRHAAHRRQGLPAHAAQRRGLRRGEGAADREGLLQPVV